ncbi:hypothetical protein ACFOTA_01225 [Chitinophaga sp. GCM10012297]|uniref:DUF4760 domain-containing protein n=1 Tax=Chitinophaga chungangae TaxID=2821488 RepID=A0ABS3Y810_9BACT|nr:hypothetical protein [Chitinophaga chungangae]MBO9150813.1 hypothetical protein [Chitinophaga chungangae]
MPDTELELLKFSLNLILATVTLTIGWFVGQRLTHHWAIRQKRKEQELSTLADLYKLYGEFFSIWKLWNFHLEDTHNHIPNQEIRWELLKRASSAEAGVEAIFVRFASEKSLTEEEISCLGKFRQAYQSMRESITHNKKLNWYKSDHLEYKAFKEGAVKTACILNHSGLSYTVLEKSIFFRNSHKVPTPNEACIALLQITDNKWERQWKE